MAHLIVSDTLGKKVCRALDIDPGMVSRVIVDIPTASVVRVYVEMFGSSKLLDVDWTLDGAEITTLERPE